MSDVWLPVIVAMIGGGGVVGAVVALLKLPSERTSAAVTNAEGAMKMMRDLNDELREAKDSAIERGDRWKRRALRAEGALAAHGLSMPPLPPDLAALEGELDD